MAWTSINKGEQVTVTGTETSDDGSLSDFTSCLTDAATDTSCVEVKYDDMTPAWIGIRIEINIDPATIDTGETMQIRLYCQEAMTAGKLSIAPYTDFNTIDDTNAALGPEIAAAGNFDIDLTAALIGDCADLGGGVFALRLYSTTAEAAKIKTSELSYELSIVAGGTTLYFVPAGIGQSQTPKIATDIAIVYFPRRGIFETFTGDPGTNPPNSNWINIE